MTRYQIVSIFNVLSSIKATTKKTKLIHYININMDLINSLVESYKEVQKPIQELETEREKLCVKYCVKNDNNEPVIENNEYVLGENKAIFNTELITLKESFQSKIDEINTFFSQEEEKDINFIKIDIDLLPDEIDNADDVITILKPLIK